MKVSLVYCGIGVAGFNANRPKGDREGSWISHGLASIAASCRSKGYFPELIDLRQLSGWDEFNENLKNNPAYVYGLSVSAVDYASALQAMIEIKTIVPQAIIIVGGIHPSIMPQEYDFAVINTVVMGEGEITFPKLLEMVKNGEKLPKKIQGEKPNLNEIPWIDRELFDYQRELDCVFGPDHPTPSITMLAGRGCPYRCSYCQPAENVVFGRPYRLRSAYDVTAEMLLLKAEYDYQSVTFWDDTFTFNKKWVLQFADLVEKKGIKTRIAACSRADIVCGNEDMIERLAQIGVDWLVIGLESGSQRLLDFINKGTTVSQNIKAVEICRKYGIKVFATLMFGLPTETRAEADMTTAMIDQCRPDIASPFWYVPIPGTELYEYCRRNDLLLNNSGEETIERTGRFRPALKGVDYEHLAGIMEART